MADAWTAVIDRINSAARRLPTWPVYLLGLSQIPWLFWQALNGALGVEPIEALEHRYGLLGLQCLVAGLSISLLRRFPGINLIRFRRAVGLVAFALISAHLLVWLVLDVQSPAAVWKDIVKRPYITIGMLGFATLLPLAMTSTDRAIRKLGARRWRQLHRLTYAAVLLGCAHYVMQVKGGQIEPLVYLGVTVCFLGLRLMPKRSASRRA